jgi:hypothetical protein
MKPKQQSTSEIMNSFRQTVVILASLGLLAVSALSTQAQIINVGNIELLPNTPNQLVTINVSGGVQVEALDFWVQIADGLNLSGPQITSVDIVTGTIFAGNNGGQYGSSATQQPQRWYQTTDTLIVGTTVPTSGLLASLRIDTTGVAPGSYALNLKDVTGSSGGTAFWDTTFANPVFPLITDGTLTVVPEPQQYALVAGLGLLGLAFGRRFVRFA